MSLVEYFSNAEGVGILGTADSDGNVNMAVYAHPHMIDDENVAFIMRDRRSHGYIESNPKAAYLFMESGAGYKGKRLYLKKTGEDSDPEVIASYRKKERSSGALDEKQFLVYFAVESVRPLVGG